MATEAIARNFRRSLMIPITPNTGAAKNDKYISRPTRTREGLPQPGRSNIKSNIINTDMTRQVTAASPKEHILARL